MADSHSVASSKASTASTKGKMSVAFFSQVVPIFPFFSATQSQAPASLVLLGCLIQTIQMLAFTINPHLNHGESLGAIAPIVYASHLPFWDTTFVGTVTFSAYLAPFFIAAALVIGTVGSIAIFFASGAPVQAESKLFAAWRIVIHLITSVLYVPLLQGFLSQMVCNQQGQLWVLVDQACHSGLGSLTFIVGSIAFILLVILTLLTQTCLFRHDPESSHLLARAHCNTDYVSVGWKTVSCILFHVLLADEKRRTWLPMYIFFSAAAMIAVYAFFLPYYSQWTNRYFTSATLLVSLTGLVVYLCSETNGAGLGFAFMDIDGLLFFSCGLAVLWIGQWIADLRINSELIDSLPNLVDANAAAGPRTHTIFPSGLPVYDLAYQPHRELCSEIADQPHHEQSGNHSQQDLGNPEGPAVLCPFISAVHAETDVELATRFLRCTEAICPQFAKTQSVVLATRIFTKGLTRFQDSAVILVSFAYMIASFGGKASLALQQAERVNRVEASFPVRFHAYKVQTRLKAELNLRDTTYQRIYDQAKKLHKETLMHMQQFWSKLLQQQVDVSQLTVLCTLITARREEGNRTFLTALQYKNNDRMLLTKYAGFLEQVMLEPEHADQLRVISKQEMEDRKKNAMRGAKGANANQDQAIADVLLQQQRTNPRGTTNSSNWRVLSFVTILVLLALCGGLILFSFLTMNLRISAVRCVDVSGQTRTLATQGGLFGFQYFYAGPIVNGTPTLGTNDSTPLINAIDATAQDMLSLFNLQTIGEERPQFARKEFMTSKKVLSSKYYSATDHTVSPTTMWDLGYDVVQFLMTLGPLLVRFNSDKAAKTYNATVVEVQSAKLMVTNVFETWIATAFNASVAECVTTVADANDAATIALVLLFGASVCTLCAILAVITLSVNRVARLKHSILSLFPLIPADTLQRIAAQAKERVDSYDEQDQEDSSGLPQLQESAHRPGDAAHASPADNDRGEDNEHQTQEDSIKQRLLSKEAAEKRKKAEADEGEHDQENASIVPDFSFSAFGVFLVVLAAVLGLCVAAYVSPRASDTTWDDAVVRLKTNQRQYEFIMRIQNSSFRTFASGLVEDYQEVAAGINILKSLTASLIALKPSVNEISLLKDVALIDDDLANKLMTYLQTFLRFPSTTFSEFIDPSTPPTPRPGAAVGESLRRGLVLAVNGNAEFAEQYRAAVRSLQQTATSVAKASSSKTEITALNAVIIALCAGLTLFALLVIVPLFNSNAFIFFSAFSRRLFILTVALLLIVASLKAGELHLHQQLEATQVSVVDTLARHSDALFTYSVFVTNVRKFVLTALPEAYDIYFDYATMGGSEFLAADMATATDFDAPSYFAKFATYAQLQRREELIGIKLIANATGFSDPFEVAGVTWNFDEHEAAVQLRANYPFLPLRYTNATYDLSLPAWYKTYKGRFAVFSPYYENVTTQAARVVAEYYTNKYNVLLNDVASDRNIAKALSVASAVISGASLLVGAVYVVWTVTAYTAEIQQSNRRVRDTNGVLAQVSSGGNALKIGALVILGLLAGTFAVGMVSIVKMDNAGTNVDAGNSREWIVVQSLMFAEKFRANISDAAFSQSKLQTLLTELRTNREIFYFGVERGTYNVPGSDDAQDALLFGQNQNLSSEFACGYEPRGTYAAELLLQKGLTIAQSTWERYLETLIVSSSPHIVNYTVVQMRNTIQPLLRALRQSNSLLRTSIEGQLHSYNNIFVALAAISAGMIVIAFMWILLPLLQQQDTEESGSKLLLRLIPSDVCESVPAIQEFLESELSGENHSSSTGSETSDTSTTPCIAIDIHGTVLKFNAAAEAIFGYTAAEVIGNNISILMPEKIAKMHDSYLASYRKTGNRRVIGYDRQLHAKRKTGELFPVELNVKEFKRDNGEFVYIGFVKDITKNLELKGTEELNNLIQEFATVPMIAIDSLGTVLRFNRAAEDCFGQQISDVVNQNIKMLMPEEIAARHDSYLAAYLRTREKHVIDSTRRVEGLRKSGEVFPLELCVKEITSEFGAMSTYLGFCRDLTQDNILDEANRINDEVTDLSPVPIVGIDPYGKVLKFSKAACVAFGYEQSEVLDRNVKMLMPEAIAEQHDGYLETYRQTGKKKIVGTEREVVAQKKDGTQMPVMVLIREVKKEGSANGTFVGYLIPLSEEKSNAHFKAIDDVIVEMHPVPLVTMNAIGTITRINKALLLEFGYRKEEVLDKNVKMLMPQEVAQVHDEYLKRYAETKVAHIIGSSRRVHGKRKNGTTFPVEVKVEEALDADGKSFFIGFLRNLTADLGVEQQFAINTTNLEISPTPMIVIDGVGTVKIFSRAAEVCFRRSATSVVGQNVKMLMPPYIADQHDSFLARYAKTGIKSVIDSVRVAEGMDADGRTFPLELSVREVKREGQEHFFVAYCRDMTRDGETQKIIYRNTQISDLSPLPLIQIDLYGMITQFNLSAQHEFGYKRDEVIGRNIKMIIPDEIAKHHDHYLAQYRKTRVKSVIGSLRRTRGRRKDGSTFAVEISVAEVVVDNDPERNSYVGYIRDITEELRLLKANEVSGVISDLSPNPLVAITKKGSVITFNRAACIAFRYSDSSHVLGNNVKMLMPDEIAVRHDGFLTAYAKTGEKHVVDTTRAVKAKRSDGTCFPAEISVREINKEGKESTFLSYIRDCTEEVAMAHATQVSDAIQSLSAIPMIIIDVFGTVKRVNQATLPMFGFVSENEIVGKNVKILMPQEIAVNHDVYLSAYLKTGVKRIIDSVRQVSGRRQNGTIFPAEVSVREVKSEDNTIYIGYLRDLSSAKEVEAARAVNEAMASSSVVPLIVINIKGIVQMFVPAAEEFFGYSAAEVVGKNLKMLMPVDIAAKHDGYLAAYAETGVKHVVDSTRIVTARLKSGDHKPVSITVKEVPSKSGVGKNFIGYIMDQSNKFAVSRALKIADSVRDMMTISIISITEDGSIRQFNRAAEEFFGYKASDVIGKNVKMLMPPEVARNHDGYLDTYRRTKVKHVIGSSRLVQGLHLNGDLLDVELHVSEFLLDGKPNYIAFATDRKHELELQRSAMINEALVSLSLVPIVAIDNRNCISRFSSSAEMQFGWSAKEIVGKNVNVLMLDNVAQAHDGYLARYRNSGNTYASKVVDKKIEVVAKKRDGTTFPAELIVKEIKKEGQVSSFVGYIRDIENELAVRSNAVLCAAIESLLPDPIVVIDNSGVVQSFSPMATRLFGFSKEEVLGRNVKMLMPEAVAVEHDNYLKRYMATKVKHVVDTQRRVTARKKSGEEIEVELRVKELQVGEKSFFIGYVRDTSRDFDLAIETEVGEALMELNPDAIITINPKGIILKFNAQAEKLFQFERKQIIGRNVKVLMPDAIAERHDMYLASYLKTGIKRIIDTSRQVSAEKKNGDIFPAEVSVREVRDESGQIQYFIGYVREVSGKKTLSATK